MEERINEVDVFAGSNKVTPQERMGQAIFDLRAMHPEMTASQRADILDSGAWLYVGGTTNGNGHS